jgi:4-cresol dehydrogenase (hydroxylating)
LENLLSRLRISSNNRLLAVVKKLGQTMSIMEGRPSEVALPLAYWKSGIPAVGKDKNPARDGCGLIWYAPLVPMKPPLVREYVDLVDAVCADHGIEPLVTLTTLSERCFDSTVPILYDLASEAEAKRAEACYLALFEEGKKRGFLPYRLGVNSMHLINDEASIFWTVQRKISASLDPNQIISPGRYDRGAKPKS